MNLKRNDEGIMKTTNFELSNSLSRQRLKSAKHMLDCIVLWFGIAVVVAADDDDAFFSFHFFHFSIFLKQTIFAFDCH